MRFIALPLLLAAIGLPAPSQSTIDIRAFADSPSSRQGWAEPFVGRGGAAHVGAVGPFGTPVIVTVDLSKVDTSRVTVTNTDVGCQRQGDVLRCETGITSNHSDGAKLAMVFLGMSPVNSHTGPAGYVTFKVEPAEGPDPNPADNAGRLDIDVRNDAQTRFSVKAASVQGAVGDTVTVPVTIANQGPNTVKDVVFYNPTGGAGKEFAGGDGCGGTPVPKCAAPRVPPGTAKTVSFRFHIRRCASAGETVDGAVPVNFLPLTFIQEPPTEVRFRINVRGCAALDVTSSAAAGASPSPLASSEPVTESPVPAEFQPEAVSANRHQPVFTFASGLFLLIAALVVALRLHRRRTTD